MLPIQIQLPEHFLEEETRCGYTISEQMKQVWAVQLDLLLELRRVCEAHGIEYIAAGGTILGTVRHRGFIPWDDDIDIMMTRENYRKFCDCADAFSEPYFLQTEYTDPGSLRGHAQLRNSRTTGILRSEKDRKYSFHQGIFIDIFPLDHLPDDPSEMDRFLDRLHLLRRLARGVALLTTRYGQNKEAGLKNRIIRTLGPLASRINRVIPVSKWVYMVYEKQMQRYNGKKTRLIGTCPVLQKDQKIGRFEASVLADGVVFAEFEWLEIPIPRNYLQYLTYTYGDWQKYVIGGSLHGDVLFDAETCYTEYLKS